MGLCWSSTTRFLGLGFAKTDHSIVVTHHLLVESAAWGPERVIHNSRGSSGSNQANLARTSR